MVNFQDSGTTAVLPANASSSAVKSTSSSSVQPPKSDQSLEFRVYDVDGNIEVTQDQQGYVRIPTRASPIGRICFLFGDETKKTYVQLS